MSCGRKFNLIPQLFLLRFLSVFKKDVDSADELFNFLKNRFVVDPIQFRQLVETLLSQSSFKPSIHEHTEILKFLLNKIKTEIKPAKKSSAPPPLPLPPPPSTNYQFDLSAPYQFDSIERIRVSKDDKTSTESVFVKWFKDFRANISTDIENLIAYANDDEIRNEEDKEEVKNLVLLIFALLLLGQESRQTN